jgi:hypothetical protein
VSATLPSVSADDGELPVSLIRFGARDRAGADVLVPGASLQSRWSTCRVAQVAAAGGPLEIVEREVPQPGPGHVRIAVDACGICHSDSVFVDALLPGVRFPLIPGHEIAGRIEELGDGTHSNWQVGDRVAVGWFGGSCGHCTPCRQGDFIVCENLKVPGWAYDGGVRRGGDRAGRRPGPDPRRPGRDRCGTSGLRGGDPRTTGCGAVPPGRAIWSPYSASAASATWG